MLFAFLEAAAGEMAPEISAQAEDARGNIFSLTVEYVGNVSEASGVSQINIKLHDQLPKGDVWVSIKKKNSTASNKALLKIT
jgi:uncharacterized protein (TIGR03437 family)